MPSSTISSQTSGIEHFPVRSDGRDPPLRLTFGDVFIILASGLVAMAIAIGLVVQIGLDVPRASGLAGMAMVATLIGHAALRISDHRRAPVRRSRQDLSHENEEYRPSVAALPRHGVTAAEDGAATSRDGDRPNVPRRGSGDINSEVAGEAPADMRGAVAIGGLDGDQSAPLPAAGQDSLDLGKVRPRQSGALNVHDEVVPIGDGAPVGPGNIDAMIKRLASDIETGRKSRAIAPAKDGRSGGVTSPPPLPVPAVAAGGQPPLARDGAQTAQQKKSRLPAFPPKLDALDTSPPATAASPTATAKLAAIADALSDEQLDVYLETINGLDDYRAQHYEVSVRLRLDGGEVLDNAAFTEETRGTGLLPLIEAVKVSSTKRLAVQMIRRGRSGDFFAAIDGEALSEMQFGTDVGTITSGDPILASRLVLAFTQADVRGLTKAQHATLEEIASLGFRFSVESITDLDMDFHDLARRGFAFAKLDALVFLGGLPLGSGHVPPTDLCRHLADAGLDLIVGSIGTEDARARILDCGATLGQGALFGAPRPVRASVLKPATEKQMAAQQRP